MNDTFEIFKINRKLFFAWVNPFKDECEILEKLIHTSCVRAFSFFGRLIVIVRTPFSLVISKPSTPAEGSLS